MLISQAVSAPSLNAGLRCVVAGFFHTWEVVMCTVNTELLIEHAGKDRVFVDGWHMSPTPLAPICVRSGEYPTPSIQGTGNAPAGYAGFAAIETPRWTASPPATSS